MQKVRWFRIGGSCARFSRCHDGKSRQRNHSDDRNIYGGCKARTIRDGVPPIELVDGEKLVRMLEDLELGLVPVKAYEVADDFFDEFQS